MQNLKIPFTYAKKRFYKGDRSPSWILSKLCCSPKVSNSPISDDTPNLAQISQTAAELEDLQVDVPSTAVLDFTGSDIEYYRDTSRSPTFPRLWNLVKISQSDIRQIILNAKLGEDVWNYGRAITIWKVSIRRSWPSNLTLPVDKLTVS